MKKLVVFDWEKFEVHTYSITDKQLQNKTLITTINNLGHNDEHCDYMVVDNDSKIINH